MKSANPTASFPPDLPADSDPEEAAVHVIALFGDEAEEIAHRRAAHFGDIEDDERWNFWLMVRGHISDMQRGNGKSALPVH